MEEKTTEILEFKIEQGDAITELERTKKSIIGLKQEQKDLNKAYKEGNVTLDEYASDSVRLEQILRKESRTYTDLTKSVTGTKTGMDKLIESNNRLADSVKKQNAGFVDFSKNVNVGGQSLEGITSKLSGFLTPATAAAGAVSALGALYLSSAAGARDLESAQTQLSTSLTLVSNDLAKLVGADGKGGGLLSSFAFTVNKTLFGLGAAVSGQLAANAKQAIKELEIVEVESKRAAKAQLDLAEQQRRIRDDQTKSDEERRIAAESVEIFIDKREQILVKAQEDKLANMKILLALDSQNLELQKQVKLVEFEIADIQEDSQGKRTEALNGINALEKESNAEKEKAVELTKKQGEAEDKRVKDYIAGIRKTLITDQMAASEAVKIQKDAQIQTITNATDALKQEVDVNASFSRKLNADRKKFRQEDIKGAEERAMILTAIRQQELMAAQGLIFELGRLGSESSKIQRATALAQIAIDTASAISSLTKNSEANPLNGPTAGIAGTIQFASGIVRILANVNQARKLLGGGSGGSSGNFDAGSFEAPNIEIPKIASLMDFKLFSQKGPIGGGQLFKGINKFFKKLFAEGGYTGDGGKYDPAGLVHKGEVVWSQKDVAAVGGANVANAMRPTFKGYYDGGVVTESITSGIDQRNMMADIFSNMPAPILDYAEFTNFKNKVQYKEKITQR